MAIWDRQEDTVITGSADSHKCLSCGGNLMYQPEEGALVCRHCGNKHFPETFEVNDILSDRKFAPAGDEEEGKHEIVCNACGSTVITDKNTMSTFCAFCGSPAVNNRHLDTQFRPDYIIPFKLTQKEAEKNIRQWSTTRRMLPFSFNSRATYSKLTGLYVPFWLVDADCQMNTVGSGVIRRRELGFEVCDYYDVRRQGTFKMKRVPFDGSRKINDRIMEAIEPFDYSEMVPFSSGYLQGFYSEKYDQAPVDLSLRIANRFHDYMYEVTREYMHVNRYHEYHYEEDKSKAQNFDFKYALMPVWFMSYKYHGHYYRIAVNGQTGEVAGHTPESGFKMGMSKFWYGLKAYSKVILVDLFVAAVMAILGMIYVDGKTTFDFLLCYFLCLGACLVLTLCNALGISFLDDTSLYGKIIEKLVIKVRNDLFVYGNDINVMDKMPDVYEYFDKTQHVDIEKSDRLVTTIQSDGLTAGDIHRGILPPM